MGQREITEKIRGLSEGIFSSVVDLVLFSIYFGFEFASAGYSAKSWKSTEKALEDLSELNYLTIRRGLYYLKQKGFVKTIKQVVGEEITLPRITKEGKQRLKALIPSYREKRTWDGRIYLITYDIPINNNAQRDSLRDFLKKIGCAALQKSIWISPYNPKQLIKDFVRENNLDENLILISSLEKEGTIGNTTLPRLLNQIYKLEELNERYKAFLNLVGKGVIKTKEQIAFSYLAILRDDPQIPFELLPPGWKGDKAYQVFKNYIGRD